MSRAARILSLAAAVMAMAAAPAAAQSARATVTASATVVEPISFVAGPSTVAATRSAIDVTTPVAVQGRAAHVVQVLAADDDQPQIRASVGPRSEHVAENGATASAYDVRLRVSRDAAARGPQPLRYVVATVN
jgi:hypothetical protein